MTDLPPPSVGAPPPPPPPPPVWPSYASGPLPAAPPLGEPLYGAPVPCEPKPNVGWAALAAVAAVAVAFATWWGSNGSILRTADDGHFVWVQVSLVGTAGLGWGLLQPGANRLLRAVMGAAVGMAAGAGGAFLLGTAKLHGNAAADEVLSGASLARALGWAAFGAVAWGATLAVATPPQRAVKVGLGAALGGAAVGAGMGVLAGTYVFGENVIPTDVWWSLPIKSTDVDARALPVLILAVAVPMVLATTAGSARRLVGPVAVGVAACLFVPGIAAAAGYSTDLDQARRDGLIDSPADVRDALGSLGGGGGDRTGSVSVGEESDKPQSDERESDDEGGSASAATVVPDTSPPVSLEPPPAPDPETTLSPPPTPAPAGEPAAEPAPAPTTEPAPDPGPTIDTVPTDVDPGFPVVIDWRINAENEHGQLAESRIFIGPAYRNDTAPAVWGGGETCALGPDDGVIPFYARTTPYNGGTSEVQLSFSQSLPGFADTIAHPMAVEFNDYNGKRCVDATSADIDNTAARYVWQTLADGESGGGDGYFIIPNYFDSFGNVTASDSAVLVITPIINQTFTSSQFQVYGTSTADYIDPASGELYSGVWIAP